MRAGVRIVALGGGHRAGWERLHAGYAEFYRVPRLEGERLETLWGWLMDAEDGMRGVVAEGEEGEVLGFAHFCAQRNPLRAGRLMYLHDLYVAPEARGAGIGEGLIGEVLRVARGEGCFRVRWATRADNEAARRLYERVGVRTDWVVYDLEC